MSSPAIFVSYAWKGESEALVNQLCEAFAARGYQITRDKSTLTYKHSIKNFMERIGRGKFIIAVVGDKYMKSENCMYEAYRMFQSPAFGERVFPIVLPDADIFSFRGQVAYLKHWELEYEALEAEYKKIANSSPTMAAPLTERLRDIEATTRFINDFMAAVSDMNVLTSQMHAESNFDQLLQAIEARIAQTEQAVQASADSERPHSKDDSQKKEAGMQDKDKIETGGGAYVHGNVNTGGGDFVGRDKKISGGGRSVVIGGNATGSPIVVGDHNTVTNTNTHNVFAPVYRAIQQAALPTQAKADLQAEVKEIEAEVVKGELVDETFLARRLRNLKRMAPKIAEVAFAALAGPGAAVAAIVKQVAGKIQAEA